MPRPPGCARNALILLAACDLAARTLHSIQDRWENHPDFPDRVLVADVLRDLDATLAQARQEPA